MSAHMNEFLRVAGECGKSYLATGGPTSRLEERLMTAGHVHGYKCDVYATPTAVTANASRSLKP